MDVPIIIQDLVDLSITTHVPAIHRVYRAEDTTRLVTHNGKLHADDVLAYTFLHMIFPSMKLHRIGHEAIERGNFIPHKSDIIFDIGLEYDPCKNRFDHHQDQFNGWSCDISTPMAAVGMVFKCYSHQLFTKCAVDNDIDISRLDLHKLASNFYMYVIREIDCADNGVSPLQVRQYRSSSRSPQYRRAVPRDFVDEVYKVNMTLSSRISGFNLPDVYDHENQLIRFTQASEMAKTWVIDEVMVDFLKRQCQFVKDSDNMKKAFNSRYDLNKSGQIIDTTCCLTPIPHIMECEKTGYNPGEPLVKFLIYQWFEGTNEKWGLKTITDGNFQSRIDILPLKTLTHMIPDLTNDKTGILFMHKQQFLAIARSKEMCLKIAHETLDYTTGQDARLIQ
jgi:uncharacterized UPF0160 family protein